MDIEDPHVASAAEAWASKLILALGEPLPECSFPESWLSPSRQGPRVNRHHFLPSDGGGTRGFASLLMLNHLMDEIKTLEQAPLPPQEATNGFDPSDWIPHNSSFGPQLQPGNGAPATPVDLEAESQEFLDGMAPEQRRARAQDERGNNLTYLPCHYFDYIGGTSTGG